MAKQTERYTGGENISITIETVHILMQSIFYCIRMYLKIFPDMDGSLEALDVDYAAHDTPGSLDYPLGNDPMDLVGIEYIYSYLHKLNLENAFCTIFPMDEIESLLRGYNENYQDLLINIFGLILTNAIGSVLAGKHAFQLKIEPSDIQMLHQKLLNLSGKQMEKVLQTAATQLCQDLHIENVFLQEYISKTV